MEARILLLISLVLVLCTTRTTGQDYCATLDDGPYCAHCWQPITCTGGMSTTYDECEKGMACIVALGASFCVSHSETECICTSAGDQCDAYNSGYVEHCLSSGPILVEACPEGQTCYGGECGEQQECTPSAWSLTPDCTGAVYCDADGAIIDGVTCADGEYVNSNFECSQAPIAACDGSCIGRCPNPVDCKKYFICQGTSAIQSGGCPDTTAFDIETNECIAEADATCTFLDTCDLDVDLGTAATVITSSADSITTIDGGITTTAGGPTTTAGGPTTTAGGTTTTAGGTTTTAGGPTTTAGGTTTTAGGTTTTAGGTTTTAGGPTTTAGGTTTTAGGTTTTAGGTTTTAGGTTTTAGITTTTESGIITMPPEESCNASTVGNKYPYEVCSNLYYSCVEVFDGDYQYIVNSCLGDFYFNTDPNLPYCMDPVDILTC